ncbi:MAG: Asp-tRNA(Asn)/Glu-tRNA(Gln) amidotransferase subunit GatC [Patescibacteria group bacterium]|nr:Asp-tRNA(Asn)/Glu-tRNA(Gln) amidotransferase subunit GatC [Patescibacteria group bacterium]
MKIDIKHTSKLANLELKPEEVSKFEKQLSQILEYVEKLKELNTKNIEPTSQVTGLVNINRSDDKTLPSLSQDEALLNTQSKHNGLFKVKAILEDIMP